jgi:hypothetical protein
VGGSEPDTGMNKENGAEGGDSDISEDWGISGTNGGLEMSNWGGRDWIADGLTIPDIRRGSDTDFVLEVCNDEGRCVMSVWGREGEAFDISFPETGK